MGDSLFRVLDTEADRGDWLDLWAQTGREPFAHPDYVALFSKDGEHPRLLAVSDAVRCAIMPVVLRPLASQPWSRGLAGQDATSPYGYGGPFSATDLPSDFWLRVRDWLVDSRLASFFGRLSLGTPVPSALPDELRLVAGAENVVVNVTRPPEVQWMHYEHKVRKNVNKARRAQLVASLQDTFTDTGEFTELYHSTMGRRSAARSYYFDVEFFARISTVLAGSHWVAEVRDPAGRLVSAELVLVSDHQAYSFLGGTYAEAFPYAPNDLLKHAVIEHARTAGLSGYVLGGGYQAGDGIFKYKRGFDPHGVRAFHRLEASVATLCEGLVSLRLAEERRVDPSARLQPGFFPRYRAPLAERAGPD